ncbi:MAG: hypothetical protein A2284_14345 [Deltaproteobacteria bacterium RIFOXYA12_FULL_61_11]|nr:MAG: hypothetical protein A2284_14345 [Deltaproteobacteria bacterium RIFOXYA12_FULL_61_11]
MKTTRPLLQGSGFSLIEVMLVIIISAIIAISAVKLFNIYESRLSTETVKSDTLRQTAIVSTLLKAEIEQMGVNVPRMQVPIIYPQYVNPATIVYGDYRDNDIITYLRAEKYPGDTDLFHSYPPIPVDTTTDNNPLTSPITLRRCTQNTGVAACTSLGTNFDPYLTGTYGVEANDFLLLVTMGQSILLKATSGVSCGDTTCTVAVDRLNGTTNYFSNGGIYFRPLWYQEYDYDTEALISSPCNLTATALDSFPGWSADENKAESYLLKVNLVQLQVNSSNQLVRLTRRSAVGDLDTFVLLDDADSFKVEYVLDLPGSYIAKDNTAGRLKAVAGFTSGDLFDDVWVKPNWKNWNTVYDQYNEGPSQASCSNLSGFGGTYTAYPYQNPFCRPGGTVAGNTQCRSAFVKQVYFRFANEALVAGTEERQLRVGADPAAMKTQTGVQLPSSLVLALSFNDPTQTKPDQYSIYNASAQNTIDPGTFYKSATPLSNALTSGGLKSAGSAATYATMINSGLVFQPSTDSDRTGMQIEREMTFSAWVKVDELENYCIGEANPYANVSCSGHVNPEAPLHPSDVTVDDAKPLWLPVGDDSGDGGVLMIARQTSTNAGYELFARGSNFSDSYLDPVPDEPGKQPTRGSIYFRMNETMSLNQISMISLTDPSNDKFPDGWANITIVAKADPGGGSTQVNWTVRNRNWTPTHTKTEILTGTMLAASTSSPLYIGTHNNSTHGFPGDIPEKYTLRVPTDEVKLYKEERLDAQQKQDALQFDYSLKNDVPPFYAVFADDLDDGFMLMRREDQ